MNNETKRELEATLPHLSSIPFSNFFLKLLSGRWSARILLAVSDLLAVSFSFLLANLIFSMLISASSQFFIHLYLIPITSVMIILSLHMQDGYKHLGEQRPESVLAMIFMANLIGFLMTIMIVFLVQKRLGYSRYIILFWFAFSLIWLNVFRFLIRGIVKKFWSRGLLQKRVLFVGKGESLEWIISHLKTQGHKRFNFIGIVHNNKDSALNSNPALPYLGNIEDLSSLIKKYRVDRVILDRGSIENGIFTSTFDVIREEGVELNVISPAFLSVNAEFFLDDFTGLFTLRPKIWPLRKFGNRVLKRSLDLIIASLSLPFLFCMAGVFGIIIKIQDRGPIFYRRRVVGKEKREFDAFKFRSMRIDADEVLNKDKEMKKAFEKDFKLRDDLRITKIGRFIRKSSLDELPQLFNVLRGEMSIVGPRMIVMEELERYGDFAKERFKVKPGITGYWQVMGRQEIIYEERIKMDRFYIEYWSIWMDIVIILQTFWKVLKREGAY